MGKMIGATEFKAHCLRILDEVERTGESVTITKRGRIVGELHPPRENKEPPREKKETKFGFLKHPEYRFEDPFGPAYEGPWNAELDRDEDDPGTGLA
jgi:prevent-host-death family protein